MIVKLKKLNRFKIFVTAFFVVISLNLFTSSVFAHVLKTDGSIGAVMHIDPDDDPIAGSQSSFFFEFKDKQNKFTPQNCNCTFSITENGKEIYTQPLFQTNPSPTLENASVFYTFPKEDVYQLKVSGTPETSNGFQPFTLTYDVRVDREVNSSNQTSTQSSPNWLSGHIILIVGLIIIVLFAIFGFLRREKT